MIWLLGALLVASWAAQLIRERQVTAERRRLLNAALASTPSEFVALEREAKRTPRKRRDDDEGEDTPLIGVA